jgi:cysteine desulfurase/selenocysteine lyase
MRALDDIVIPHPAGTSFDVARIRSDFPILKQQVNGKPLVYLDNAATSQKPQSVIDAMNRFYLEENSNIHRGVHTLSDKATQSYEEARMRIQKFINAPDLREIVFVRSTTEGINLVARSYGARHLSEGDELIISAMEHHSNIVPWQMMCEETGARLRVIPMSDEGELDLGAYARLFNGRTKLVPVLVDGAQAVPHLRVDVRALDCDFYAFSGHKMFGPTGIGILYGKLKLLEGMPPYQGGGDMIKSVSFEKTTYNDLPHKFEAGTPNISGGVGLGEAVRYLSEIDFEGAMAHERDLLRYATSALSTIEGLRIIGTAKRKAGVLSFVIDGIHPHDIGTILDDDGIAIRTGHHCAQPVMQRFGIPATARASFAFYNTAEEVDALVRGIHNVRKVLS